MSEIGTIEFDYENNVICIFQEKEWHDYSIRELKDYLNDMQQQLQAYKDKEDKLRELIAEPCANVLGHDILQILNEGSDE